MTKKRRVTSETPEERILYALQEKGFTDIERPEETTNTLVATRGNQKYRILTLVSGSERKYDVNNRTQESFLRSVRRGESPLCCVYFTQVSRTIIKNGKSSTFQPYDGSLF